jgi:hypothetical protein
MKKRQVKRGIKNYPKTNDATSTFFPFVIFFSPLSVGSNQELYLTKGTMDFALVENKAEGKGGFVPFSQDQG